MPPRVTRYMFHVLDGAAYLATSQACRARILCDVPAGRPLALATARDLTETVVRKRSRGSPFHGFVVVKRLGGREKVGTAKNGRGCDCDCDGGDGGDGGDGDSEGRRDDRRSGRSTAVDRV